MSMELKRNVLDLIDVAVLIFLSYNDGSLTYNFFLESKSLTYNDSTLILSMLLRSQTQLLNKYNCFLNLDLYKYKPKESNYYYFLK